MRREVDSLGGLDIKKELYYGVHTERALQNFKLSNFKKINLEIIRSVAIVKLAAAEANLKSGKLAADKAEAIKYACEEIFSGKYDDQFPLPALQGGAGTSVNMNVNEVIANLALEKLGKEKGEYSYLHPIEDVNLSQSTNDVFPTGVKIAAIKVLRELLDETMELQSALQEKEAQFSDVFKVGRTQFQDAVPITLGEEFGAYAEAISRDRWRLYKIEERIRVINIGGTAVGTGVGASLKYRYYITEELKRLTGYGLARAENLIDNTQNLDVFVEVSGLLKTMAVTLNKIANDLRLMSSGPNAGFSEIRLPAIQVGSSIMPGKVNPVGAEFIKQIYYRVLGNDLSLTVACADGEFELNAMLPTVAENLIESMELLRDGIKVFRERVVSGIEADVESCRLHLENSLSRATEFIEKFGYNKLVEILKESQRTGKPYMEIIDHLISTEK